ncbi:MAG: hypothetical protein JWQ19_2507 [Subtercola sp.]|nr:hypothetical protein [Subtercola sp.]
MLGGALIAAGAVLIALAVPSVAQAAAPGDVTHIDASSPPSTAPVDAMNGERTILPSDQLLLTNTATGSQTWAQTDPSNTTVQTVGGDPSTSPARAGRAPLTTQGASVAGHFTSPFAERTLALQATSAGPGDPVIQLSSTNDSAEWQNADFNTIGEDFLEPLPVGQTMLIKKQESDQVVTNTAAQLSEPMGSQIAVSDIQSTSPAPIEQWSVLDAGTSNGQQLVRFASRADGTCLTPVGTTAGSAVGVDFCNSSNAAEVWMPVTSADSSGTYCFLRNEATGLDLTLDDSFANLILATPTPGITNSWRFNRLIQPSAIPPSWSAAGSLPATLNPAFDLVAADLNQVAAADGLPRDEAAVAYADSSGALEVRVLDYNVGPGPLVVTAPSSALPSVGPGPITVKAADVDGDNIPELIVTYTDAQGAVSAEFLRYSTPAAGGTSLDVVAGPVSLGFSTSMADVSVGTATWDFNNDGTPDLAYAAVDPGTQHPVLHYVFLTPSFGIDHVLDEQVSSEAVVQPAEGQHSTLALATGAFAGPQAGAAVRQLALAWQTASGSYLDLRLRPADAVGHRVGRSGTHLVGGADQAERRSDAAITGTLACRGWVRRGRWSRASGHLGHRGIDLLRGTVGRQRHDLARATRHAVADEQHVHRSRVGGVVRSHGVRSQR